MDIVEAIGMTAEFKGADRQTDRQTDRTDCTCRGLIIRKFTQ